MILTNETAEGFADRVCTGGGERARISVTIDEAHAGGDMNRLFYEFKCTCTEADLSLLGRGVRIGNRLTLRADSASSVFFSLYDASGCRVEVHHPMWHTLQASATTAIDAFSLEQAR